MSVRIAVVQQDHNPGRVEENRTKALTFAASALQRGADIVLFHEELVVGLAENPRELAEPVDGPTTQAFRKLLGGTDGLVLYGLNERDGDRLFISAVLVGGSGVVATYRKTHLWWNAEGIRHEPGIYQAGDRLVTFDVKGHRSGVMICYDGDFAEMTRSYANLGCTMLFWMNNRGSRGHAEVKRLAEANSMIMAVSCCCGMDEAGHQCRGGSNITDAQGRLMAELWDAEGIITADMAPEEVPGLRQGNPWYRGRRPELYV